MNKSEVMEHLYALYSPDGKWPEGYIEYPAANENATHKSVVIFAIPAAPFHDRGNRITVVQKRRDTTKLIVSTSMWGTYGLRYLDLGFVNTKHHEIAEYFDVVAEVK